MVLTAEEAHTAGYSYVRETITIPTYMLLGGRSESLPLDQVFLSWRRKQTCKEQAKGTHKYMEEEEVNNSNIHQNLCVPFYLYACATVICLHYYLYVIAWYTTPLSNLHVFAAGKTRRGFWKQKSTLWSSWLEVHTSKFYTSKVQRHMCKLFKSYTQFLSDTKPVIMSDCYKDRNIWKESPPKQEII